MKSRMTSIPSCFLYGDSEPDVDLNFLHIERIRDRSGRHDWTIPPHVHPDHVQILLVDNGGGVMVVEGESFAIPPGSLVVVPAGLVHEFHFEPRTDGLVINAAVPFVAQLSDGSADIAAALTLPAVHALQLPPDALTHAAGLFEAALQEYVVTAPGRVRAIEGYVTLILITLMRRHRSSQPDMRPLAQDRDYELLCRYRAELEHAFRTEKTMEFYANRLGVTVQRLTQACRARTGRTASELLHERLIVEAKRHLVYMARSVAEVGYELGFDDPAYFSRFFSRRVGVAPGEYRRVQLERKAQGIAT
jgi:AraC family transcriptional regulator, transcriptional activator of pobA